MTASNSGSNNANGPFLVQVATVVSALLEHLRLTSGGSNRVAELIARGPVFDFLLNSEHFPTRKLDNRRPTQP